MATTLRKMTFVYNSDMKSCVQRSRNTRPFILIRISHTFCLYFLPSSMTHQRSGQAFYPLMCTAACRGEQTAQWLTEIRPLIKAVIGGLWWGLSFLAARGRRNGEASRAPNPSAIRHTSVISNQLTVLRMGSWFCCKLPVNVIFCPFFLHLCLFQIPPDGLDRYWLCRADTNTAQGKLFQHTQGTRSEPTKYICAHKTVVCTGLTCWVITGYTYAELKYSHASHVWHVKL